MSIESQRDFQARDVTADTSTVIANRYLTFQNLVARSEGYLTRARLHEAAASAQIAASYAMNTHPGVFASERLEAVLAGIGGGIESRRPAAPQRVGGTGGEERILHVFSLTASIGGHTRMVWRWIQSDLARRHSVAITHQGVRPVPDNLVRAVNASGGELHVLDAGRGNLIRWSADLRALALRADLVVLHTNPDDIIPGIALAVPDGLPPVVLLNHADQVFWLGVGISTLVASQRDSGLRLTSERRGVDPAHCALLPIVVDPVRRTMSRSDARRSLGLPEDAVLLLSIARPHKYQHTHFGDAAIDNLMFPDALIPTLMKHEQAVLFVVGAEADERWKAAEQQTNGRVRALGVRDSTSLYYEAADIYLDSFPITSITSLLEAGSYKVPLVSCNPYSAAAEILGSDTPGLRYNMVRVKNQDELSGTLSRLIENADLRAALGSKVHTDIAQAHHCDGWQRYLNGMYAKSRSVRGTATFSAVEIAFLTSDLDALLVALSSDQPDLHETVTHNLRNMPFGMRVREWKNASARAGGVSPGLLAPEWVGLRLEKSRINARRVFGHPSPDAAPAQMMPQAEERPFDRPGSLGGLS